jgi:cytochrome c-type biogenesis protein CcmH
VASRRAFFATLAGGSVTLLGASRLLAQQGKGEVHDSTSPMIMDSTNLFAMNQNAARMVNLPAKPNAVPQLTDAQRDDLEHRLHCQCGCTLDVFTCRTTDFSCRVSPAMHRDVMGLVKGGYSAQEIIDAFVNTYGEKVLMAPKRSGFNLIAWMLPGTAVVIGGVVVAILLKRWGARARVVQSAREPMNARNGDLGIHATDEELRRVDAAVKGERD